jgi:hypothetical protein
LDELCGILDACPLIEHCHVNEIAAATRHSDVPIVPICSGWGSRLHTFRVGCQGGHQLSRHMLRAMTLNCRRMVNVSLCVTSTIALEDIEAFMRVNAASLERLIVMVDAADASTLVTRKPLEEKGLERCAFPRLTDLDLKWWDAAFFQSMHAPSVTRLNLGGASVPFDDPADGPGVAGRHTIHAFRACPCLREVRLDLEADWVWAADAREYPAMPHLRTLSVYDDRPLPISLGSIVRTAPNLNRLRLPTHMSGVEELCSRDFRCASVTYLECTATETNIKLLERVIGSLPNLATAKIGDCTDYDLETWVKFLEWCAAHIPSVTLLS